MTATSRTLQHVGEWKVELRATTIEELFVELAHRQRRRRAFSRLPKGPGAEVHLGVLEIDLFGDRHAVVARQWPAELSQGRRWGIA